MSIVAIGLNLLLAVMLAAALWMGARLNKRLKTLRESHEGFAQAVGELNAAAARAERGLADLRAASDEAAELLGARIETARSLAGRLERLVGQAPAVPAAAADDDRSAAERRFGALLAAVQQPRARAEAERDERPLRLDRVQQLGARREAAAPPPRPRAIADDDLFDEPAPRAQAARFGGRR